MNKLAMAGVTLVRLSQPLPTRSVWIRSLRASEHGRQAPFPAISRFNFQPGYYHDRIFQRNIIRIEQRRHFSLDIIPTVLLPPVAFTGLLVALWVYKCMMMVLFQDKIIYMPYIPPFSRSEKIEDYAIACKPVEWKTVHLSSLDGTKLAICVGSILKQDQTDDFKQHMVICYFHGNAGSLPPRLPGLSSILKRITELEKVKMNPKTRYTIVALSYRGYWTSSGRASQSGIELDSQALVRWVHEHYSVHGIDLRVVLWGQSIGAGIAATAAAQQDSLIHVLKGIVLETPFSSIRSMLSAIYPQKWLPYGYLWPFLWNHWDSSAALQKIAQHNKAPRVLLLVAERDELVPISEANKLESLCKEVGLNVVRKNVAGALHNEVTARQAGREAVVKFISDTADS